jgi:AraC-like DNA-binding protein
MPATTDIEKAIIELRAAEHPNIAATARKYGIGRTRLSRHFRGLITSRDEYRNRMRLLSKQQDLRLLELVNSLSRDGFPPRPKLIRQLARDLCGVLPTRNWPQRWLKQHSDELSSGNLKGFDLARKKADSYWQYDAYFDLVFWYFHPRTSC